MEKNKKRVIPLKHGEVELKDSESAAILEWSEPAQRYEIRKSLTAPPVEIQDVDLLTNPLLSYGQDTILTELTTIQWIYGPTELIEQLFNQPQPSLTERMKRLLKEKASLERTIRTEKKINPHSGQLSTLTNGAMKALEAKIDALKWECGEIVHDPIREEIRTALDVTMKKREEYQKIPLDGDVQAEQLEFAREANQREHELFICYFDRVDESLDALEALSLL
jgi:hypothetical protein